MSHLSFKQQAHLLPEVPGVYLMKDHHGTVVYVGKAKNLRNRLSSYFRKNTQHASKIVRMVQQLASFETIVTDTELDALLLECRLIQTYRPLYNRQMNAFEQYKYFSITLKQQQLTLAIVTLPTKENCFGPYPLSKQLHRVKASLEQIYGLNSTNYWQQDLLAAANTALSPTIAYHEILAAFTQQSQKPLLRLKSKMEQAARQQAFERAQKLKQEWHFLSHFFRQQQRMNQAVQNQWELLWLPAGSKIKYYLLYQGLVINSRLLTKQTFKKYTPEQLAQKIKPSALPTQIHQYSKEQIDFLNILYSYINRQPECQLLALEQKKTDSDLS